jgi:hypothetical protein
MFMAESTAKAKQAGRTNTVAGSLVRCEVNQEKGEWISPESCAVYRIDSEARFPTIVFEIKTNHAGPYEWSWDMIWLVKACPQNRSKLRFNPKVAKTFNAKGKFSSMSKKWTADLNGLVIGGILTVTVKAESELFVRKVVIKGDEPGKEKVLAELKAYEAKHPDEVRVAKKIFQQETNFRHFFADNEPLVSFDNGYGLGQATHPVPSFEQVWNWREHIKYIITVVIDEKRESAKTYLGRHGHYSLDDLDTETLVFYNGANHHYLVWDANSKTWTKNETVICDPEQSNKGWYLKNSGNKNKSLEELKDGKGDRPIYTGRCYAEHIKKNQKDEK